MLQLCHGPGPSRCSGADPRNLNVWRACQLFGGSLPENSRSQPGHQPRGFGRQLAGRGDKFDVQCSVLAGQIYVGRQC